MMIPPTGQALLRQLVEHVWIRGVYVPVYRELVMDTYGRLWWVSLCEGKPYGWRML